MSHSRYRDGTRRCDATAISGTVRITRLGLPGCPGDDTLPVHDESLELQLGAHSWNGDIARLIHVTAVEVDLLTDFSGEARVGPHRQDVSAGHSLPNDEASGDDLKDARQLGRIPPCPRRTVRGVGHSLGNGMATGTCAAQSEHATQKAEQGSPRRRFRDHLMATPLGL